MGHNLVSLVVDPTPARIAPTKRFDTANDLELEPERGGRRDIGRFQGESGTTSRCYDTNIVPMLVVAGLGYLCALSSVFATKTSGVQHQIQDALVVFVDQLNLSLHLFIVSNYTSSA